MSRFGRSSPTSLATKKRPSEWSWYCPKPAYAAALLQMEQKQRDVAAGRLRPRSMPAANRMQRRRPLEPRAAGAHDAASSEGALGRLIGNDGARRRRWQQKSEQPAKRQHDGRADKASCHAAELIQEARKQRAHEPPARIGRVVEPDIFSGLFRAGVRQDQIGVQGRVDSEGEA